MKRYHSLYFLLFLTFMSYAAAQQNRRELTGSESATILWKISGKDCRKPSYLLGTYHLTDADWLFEYPEMKKVVDSTNFILTEKFTTKTTENQPAQKDILKALPLLTKEQFRTLDSFFVARVGEGIAGNAEAENMTVAEMESAILYTLVSGTNGPDGITKYMDLDLFTMYQKLGRSGDCLDRVTQTAFKPDSIEFAKQYLTRSFGYIKNSDKPDWNIYQTKGEKEKVSGYKKMNVSYNLNEPDDFETSTDFDFVPMKVRNKTWMHKITSNIAARPCLIAVGLAHLQYNTGLIMLLRESGYKVEPVRLTKQN